MEAPVDKVLIVDDIPEYVETISAYLEDGFSVLKAYSLEQAKQVTGENTIQLAVLDIRLDEDDPENRDGLVLLEWLRQRLPDLKVIVMSAYREFDRAVEALNAGADYFMRKPLEPDELNEIVEKLKSSPKGVS